MIDKDGGGTLSTDEIVTAVKEDKVAHAASYDRAAFTCEDSAELLFSCVWCVVVQEQPNDRFTLRLRTQDVIHFLKTCGEENLQFLLQPARLKKALKALDTDGSGEIDVEEWCGTRRPSRFTRHRRRRRV